MNFASNGFMASALVLFLVVNVAVGIYYGRNIKTIREYALGGRNFSTAVLVSTIVGTLIGGDYLFITTHQVYTTGLHYAIACTGIVVYILIISYFFIPRMGEFLGKMSVADAMGSIYGQKVKIISALCASVGSIGYIALQFKVLSLVFGHVMMLSSDLATLAAALAVITYSAMGGMKAIALTDLVQFFTFLVVIPIIAVIVSKYYFDSTVISRSTAKIFDIKNFVGLGNPNFQEMFVLFLLFSIPGLNPALFQRIVIGKNVKQVQKAFYIASCIMMLLLVLMSLIGFFIHSINPNIKLTEEYGVIYYLMDNYAGLGILVLLVMGVAAMAMSTADSHLNAAATMLTHDLVCQLKKDITDSRQLLLSKCFNFLWGIVGVCIAIRTTNMLSLIFLIQSFYMTVVTVPLILAVFGFRSSAKSVIIGMVVGVLTVLMWRSGILIESDLDSVVPGMILSAGAIFGSHYLLKQKGGWVGIKDKVSYRAIYIKRHDFYKRIISAIENFSFEKFYRENAPSNDFSYMGLGIFSLMSLIATLYALPQIANTAVDRISEIGLFISFAYVSYPIWPLSIKSDSFMQATWHLTIFILLPLMGCIFLLESGLSHLQSIIFTINIFVTLFLVPSGLGVLMILAGAWFGVSLFEYIYGSTELLPAGATDVLVYLGLALAVIFIVFVRPKVRQEKLTGFLNDTLEQKVKDQSMSLLRLETFKQEFISRLESYCIDMFHEMDQRAKNLAKALSPGAKISSKQMEEIEFLSEKLVTGSEYLLEVISRTEECFKIQPDTKTAKDFCAQLMSSGKSIAGGSALDCKFDLKDDIECDHELINKVFLGFISHGLDKNSGKKNTPIEVLVFKTSIGYDLTFTESLKEYRDAIGIDVRFKNIKLESVDRQKILRGDFGQEFAYWMQIVFSHYGKVNVKTDGADLVYSLVMPLKLSDTRPKKLDIPDQLEQFFQLMYSNIQDSNKSFQENARKNLRSMGVEEEVIRKAFYKTSVR